jgi:hypothetical protein
LGRAVLASYRWADTARMTEEVYERVLLRRRRSAPSTDRG